MTKLTERSGDLYLLHLLIFPLRRRRKWPRRFYKVEIIAIRVIYFFTGNWTNRHTKKRRPFMGKFQTCLRRTYINRKKIGNFRKMFWHRHIKCFRWKGVKGTNTFYHTAASVFQVRFHHLYGSFWNANQVKNRRTSNVVHLPYALKPRIHLLWSRFVDPVPTTQSFTVILLRSSGSRSQFSYMLF